MICRVEVRTPCGQSVNVLRCATERVDKLMENALGVSHNLTTLIHPLTTLRREW